MANILPGICLIWANDGPEGVQQPPNTPQLRVLGAPCQQHNYPMPAQVADLQPVFCP